MHKPAFFPTPLLVLPLLAALFLSACAKSPVPADPQAAQRTWEAFVSRQAPAPAPYRDSLSMRFGKEGDTRRVEALVWGNGASAIRLDVLAGVGATVAMIAQDGETFLMYAPMQRKAFFHQGPDSPLFKIGVPLPFDLRRLESLLQGRWQEVFGREYLRADAVPAGTAYDLSQGIGGRLVLTTDALPASWTSEDWTIAFELDGQGLAKRLDLASRRGDKGIVLLKEREAPQTPFTQRQTALELPPGTQVLPIERFRR
ncbi:MAG: hypothetical protein IKT16_08750 [Desulfovibrio sp.]|nr:hypothetical protein [Desulfovibrio sp.]